VIQLDKSKLILISPQLAISYVNAPQNVILKNTYLNKRRTFARRHISTSNFAGTTHFTQPINTNNSTGQGMNQFDPTTFSSVLSPNIQQNTYQPQIQS
jgi:hypothetical protein